jgi:hypothetical protein
MISLGGFLGLASAATASSIPAPSRLAWLFAVIPAVYVVADLTEDTLLAHMLMNSDIATQNQIHYAQIATTIKLGAATLAILQTILLAGLAILIDFHRWRALPGNR